MFVKFIRFAYSISSAYSFKIGWGVKVASVCARARLFACLLACLQLLLFHASYLYTIVIHLSILDN